MSHYDKKEKRILAVYVSVFLILAFSIVVGGYLSYHNFELEFQHQAEDQISAIAELKVNQLVEWRRERLGDARSFYHNSIFSGLVESYFQDPANVEIKKQIISRLEYYQSYTDYDALLLMDTTGNFRVTTPGDYEEPKKVDAALMADANSSLASDKIVFLDFQRNASVEDETHISILVPIFAEQSDGHPLGVLILRINPETYLYPYINQWPIPSETAETLLVRRDGGDVLFLNQLRFDQDAALNLRLPLDENNVPAVKAVLGQTGLSEGVDYRGQSVLADMHPIPDSPWFLVSKVDIDEVYAPLREKLWQILSIVGMATLVSGLGVTLIWRQQRMRFYQAKAEAAESLRTSEEKFRKAFILSPDSININRLQDGMYVSINNGFTRIMGYTANEVIGKTSLELNVWDDPQNRQKLVEGLKKSGEVSNLEARFRAKNGQIKYGLMSASVLELNGVQHIISITRDITERRQAQEALQESEENLAITLRSIGDGVISTDKNGLVVNMNPMAEKYCGWSLADARGKPLSSVFNIIDAETRKKVEDPVTRVMESGLIVGLANHTVLISKNGDEYQIADSAAPIKDREGQVVGVVLVFSDVTEKYKAQEKIRQSEGILADIFQTVEEGIAYTTLTGQVLSINDSLEKILEIPKAEIVGKNILNLTTDLLSAKNVKKAVPAIKGLVQGQNIQNLEVEYKDKILEVSAVINRSSGRLTGVIRDITERKQAEERLEQFFSVNPDLLCIVDIEGNFIKVNKAWESILGYPASELEHRKFLEFVHPEDLASTLEVMTALGKQEQVLDFVSRCRCQDGSYRYIEWHSQPSGNFIYAAARDITERKQSEDLLRESQEKMLSIFRVAPTGIGVVSNRVLTEVNPLISEMTGYTKEELTGQSARILYPTQEEFEWVGREKYKQIAEKGSGTVETHWQKKDGSIINVLLASTPIDLTDLSKGVTFTVLDITERKRAEGELVRQTTLFRNLFESSPESIAVLDREDRILEVNRSFETLFGYLGTEARNRHINDLLAPPPYLEDALKVSQMVLENNQIMEKEAVRCTKDGRAVDVSLIGYPIVVNGQMIGAYAIYRDITERKRVEEALRESQSMLNMVLDTVPQSIFWKDARSCYLGCNRAFAAAVGLDDPAQIIGKTDYDLPWPREEADAYRADDREVVENNRPKPHIIESLQQADGTRLWIDTSKVPLLDKDGRPFGILGVYDDITERKRVEEALKQSEAIFTSFLEHSPVYVFFKDRDTRSLMLSKNYEQMLGMPISNLLGKTMDELFPSELAKSMVADDLRILNEGRRIIVVEELNGRVYETTKFPVLKDGLPYILAGFTLDITERTRAEERLRQSEEQYRYLFENNPHPMWAYDLKTMKFLAVNDAAVDKYGYSRDEFMDMTIADIRPPQDLDRLLKDIGKSRPVLQHSDGWRHKLKDGTIIDVEISSHTLNLMDHEAALVVAQDVTERKRAEDALHASESKFRALFEQAAVGVAQLDTSTGRFISINQKYCDILGYSRQELLDLDLRTITHPDDLVVDLANMQRLAAGEIREFSMEKRYYRKDGSLVWVSFTISPLWANSEFSNGHIAVVEDITLRKQAEEALEKRIVALTQPLESTDNITFDDLFNLKEIQQLQDDFAKAAGVASIITQVDGTPITAPSNFCRLCNDIIRKTPKGYVNCCKSDAILGKLNPKGPLVQPCMSGGLWDAGAGISVGGKHVANWLIGQVRDETQTEEKMLEYARIIGVDEQVILEAFHEVSPMSREKFEQVANALFTLASQLSNMAYQNVQQARFIADRRQAEEALRESEHLHRKMNENSPLGMHFYKLEGDKLIFTGANPAADKLLGVDNSQFIGKTIEAAFPPLAQTEVPYRYRDAAANGILWSTEQIAYEDGRINGAFEVKAFQTTPGNMVAVFADITARKQAEQALRESETRYRTLFSDSPIPLMEEDFSAVKKYIDELDKVGMTNLRSHLAQNRQLVDMVRVLDVNKAALKWHRIANKEVLLGSLGKSVSAEAEESFLDELMALIENGTQYEITVSRTTKEGQPLHLIISGMLAPGSEDSWDRVLVSILDITERKQAEEALRESEQRYKLVSELTSDYIYKVGIAANGKVTLDFVTNSFNATTGRTLEESNTVEAWNKIIHPDDLGSFTEFLQNLISTRQPGSFECRSFIGGGKMRWIEVIARPEWDEQEGRVTAIVGAVKDISARKQAEEALRESEALYRQAIAVADAVPYRQSYHVGGKGLEYDFIGAEIRQITGYGPEEFDDHLWNSIVQESILLDDLARYSWKEAVDRVRSSANPVWKCEHRIRTRDGQIRWVFEAAVELRDGTGVSHGSIGLFQDITARKQAEEEIRKLNSELEQRVRERTLQLENTNKELEAFSYSVSHDLRAPLRGIDGWSQALLEDYQDKLDDQGRQYIGRVRSETQRMGRLIDDMLQLSRLTRADMVREKVDLSALAQSIIGRLTVEDPHRQVEFIIHPEIIAEGDAHLLEVAFINLLGNSFKFTAKCADARIEFGQTELEGERVFFVRDNGAGFDMTYAQKIFGAFQRMHKASEFPGSGVGLAIVQRVIHRHGGRIWADAEVGRGASFYFTLEEKI
jgi:PAS domain S-box-containing protein